MMLSRTGRDRDPPLGGCQAREGQRAPWDVSRGAPYRGTAFRPTPPVCALEPHQGICGNSATACDTNPISQHWVLVSRITAALQ